MPSQLIWNPIEQHIFKHRATHYMLLGDIIYNHLFDSIHICYLELYDQHLVMSKCHDGIYGRHFNSMAITKCILQIGYYSLTMEHDCNDYIKKYIEYQQHFNVQHIPF